jgi:hypothetical protein
VDHFRKELTRGPGAFVEVAPQPSDYRDAIRRKLLRDLHDPMIGAPDVRDQTPGKDFCCPLSAAWAENPTQFSPKFH